MRSPWVVLENGRVTPSGPAAERVHCLLSGAPRAALAAILESGPIPAVHGVVRWRIVDLCQWIFEEFRVVVAKQTLSRELRAPVRDVVAERPLFAHTRRLVSTDIVL